MTHGICSDDLGELPAWRLVSVSLAVRRGCLASWGPALFEMVVPRSPVSSVEALTVMSFFTASCCNSDLSVP